MGDAVPGRVVNSSFHLPSSNGDVVGACKAPVTFRDMKIRNNEQQASLSELLSPLDTLTSPVFSGFMFYRVSKEENEEPEAPFTASDGISGFTRSIAHAIAAVLRARPSANRASAIDSAQSDAAALRPKVAASQEAGRGAAVTAAVFPRHTGTPPSDSRRAIASSNSASRSSVRPPFPRPLTPLMAVSTARSAAAAPSRLAGAWGCCTHVTLTQLINAVQLFAVKPERASALSASALVCPHPPSAAAAKGHALRGRVVTRVAVTMTLHLLAVPGRPPRIGLQCTSICGDCRPGVKGAFISVQRKLCRHR